MVKKGFYILRDFLNKGGIGSNITYRSLIQAVGNPGTVYTYCRILRALGYINKVSRGTVQLIKIIPEEETYRSLYKEYLFKIGSKSYVG